VDYFQSLSRKARLITPIGEKPRAIATTLEVTVTILADMMMLPVYCIGKIPPICIDNICS